MKSGEWPMLKILFHFLRVFMPVEFTIVGESTHSLSFKQKLTEITAVAFFDTKWSQAARIISVEFIHSF